MTIGLDLSSLQGPHRMRGVGYTLINIINNTPEKVRRENKFIFYIYKDKSSFDPLDLLDLNGFDYEIRYLEPPKRIKKSLPGRLNLFIKLLNKLMSYADIYIGDSRVSNLNGLDAFLQTDQMASLPKGRKMKKAFIAYDVIPYVLESDYLWNYRTARINGLSRRASLRCLARRWDYAHKLRVNSKRADIALAISDTTRKDFLTYVGIKPSKIITVPLGVNKPVVFDAGTSPQFFRFVSSSWGYIKQPYVFDDVPFLLFVGGVDHRRKLDDLVTAFNHLRARGHDIKLVLAGDIMQGPSNIPVYGSRKSLEQSSYLDEIIFTGFIDDRQRDWLYKNALAFVFPSRYEGFGLPVLEAFSYGCPVIAYPNAATKEVAANKPLYAENSQDIFDHGVELLVKKDFRESLGKRSRTISKDYTWSKTAEAMFSCLQ